ncbi:Hsp33 family molecular chaperone HslO [Proteinivorax hydrogeniformans]|uniref:33 kDa chaperonin n=1 Tax=Proteinivorax hydrogeniformans TaxID=1826727 RepID=A0AAU8HRS3_9FIRM
MKDYLLYSTAANGNIRCLAAITTNLTNTAQTKHSLFPVASAALGRLLTGSLLMASSEFKGEERLNLRVKGDGPLGQVFADAKIGEVRGYVANPQVELPLSKNKKLDVKKGVGAGELSVIKDLKLKEPYVSTMQLISGEIAEDLTYYYATSEQKPSSFGLGVLVDTDGSILVSGGFLVQIMPDATDEQVTAVEERIAKLGGVVEFIKEKETPEKMIEDLLDGLSPKILHKQPLEYKCSCDRQRFAKGLISLGKEELNNMLKESKEFELSCHFCNSRYNFKPQDIEGLLREL